MELLGEKLIQPSTYKEMTHLVVNTKIIAQAQTPSSASLLEKTKSDLLDMVFSIGGIEFGY